ncbi:MAG TPA: phosphotransferase [Candidatus Saccharimonadales bacterium]|jgi:Ser/Thr protein kinase RdoA (MazF antagonist)
MLSEQILKMYGLTDAQLLPVEKGYRNESHAAATPDGKRVNVIMYKREPGILRTVRRANLVGDYLAARGFPARHTHDPRILRLSSGSRATYAALYDYLPGRTMPWDAYTMWHLKQLGAAMSTMHQLLQNAPFTLENQVTDEYLAIARRMQKYFADSGVRQAIRAKLDLDVDVPERFFRLLAGCSVLPRQQALHMDFVRSNILFDDAGDITGVLDFEKTAWGHPLFDIARTLAFLLVDCKHKTPAQIRKYFLISGYNKRGAGSFKLTATNARLLEELIDLFLLYDFYKFLRHNPYESLPANEHFVRTRALLLQRQLLAATTKKLHTSTKEGG